MVSEGLITEMQKGEIVSFAAQLECGHKNLKGTLGTFYIPYVNKKKLYIISSRY
jgi:hypothetical protein